MAQVRFQVTKVGSCNFDILMHDLSDITPVVLEFVPGAETFWVSCDSLKKAAVEAVIAAHDKIQADIYTATIEQDDIKADQILHAVSQDPEDKYRESLQLINDEQKNQNRAAYAMLVAAATLIGITRDDMHEQIVNGHTYSQDDKWNFIDPSHANAQYPMFTNLQVAKMTLDKMVGIHMEMEYQRTH